jgi:hypothetical protein
VPLLGRGLLPQRQLACNKPCDMPLGPQHSPHTWCLAYLHTDMTCTNHAWHCAFLVLQWMCSTGGSNPTVTHPAGCTACCPYGVPGTGVMHQGEAPGGWRQRVAGQPMTLTLWAEATL